MVLFGTTWVGWYQKGKTNHFTEARDSEWQWHQLGYMQVCTSLQTDNHSSSPPLSFLQAGCPSCRPTNSVKALTAFRLFSPTTHTHTHPFNGSLSGTTRVSWYQKGKTNLDFTEARDSEWQWNPLGHMQVCTSFQTDNHASTPPLSFLQAGCPSCRPTNSVKALKAIVLPLFDKYFYSFTLLIRQQKMHLSGKNRVQKLQGITCTSCRRL